MRIIAIDPGKTTGLVVIDASRAAKLDALLLAEHIPYDVAPNALRDILGLWEPDVVVMERYVISLRTIKANRYSEPLDVIGGVKFLMQLNKPKVPLILQSGSDAKTAYNDDTLKRLKLFKVTPAPHARDALRHAMLATHRIH